MPGQCLVDAWSMPTHPFRSLLIPSDPFCFHPHECIPPLLSPPLPPYTLKHSVPFRPLPITPPPLPFTPRAPPISQVCSTLFEYLPTPFSLDELCAMPVAKVRAPSLKLTHSQRPLAQRPAPLLLTLIRYLSPCPATSHPALLPLTLPRCLSSCPATSHSDPLPSTRRWRRCSSSLTSPPRRSSSTPRPTTP